MTSEKTFPSKNCRNNLHSTSCESPLEDRLQLPADVTQTVTRFNNILQNSCIFLKLLLPHQKHGNRSMNDHHTYTWSSFYVTNIVVTFYPYSTE